MTTMIKRKKKPATSKYSDESFIGLEPDWKDADKWTGEKYYRERSRVAYYYSYYFKTKDFVSWVADWMPSNGYSKEDIKAYKSAEDWRTKSTLGGYVRALSKGMPDNHEGVSAYMKSMEGLISDKMPSAIEEVKKEIDSIIEIGKKIKTEKAVEEKINVTKYKPSIQQLLFNKSLEMSDKIEDFIEEYDGSTKMLTKFDPQRMLLIVGAKPNHAKLISSMYQPMFADFNELVNPPSTKDMDERQKDMYDQLKEGYSHMSKDVIKNQFKMYKTIIDACDNIILKGKATRKPRKKKIISAEKQVKNFKYLDHHSDTKSISINPADIVGANGVVVYNSKTRKLGIYHASNVDPMGLKRDGSGLSVKGSTIHGFSESKSVCKTLRKPIDQLAVFKKGAKRTIIKEFDAINSVEVKMNGRCNVHCLIIKVF